MRLTIAGQNRRHSGSSGSEFRLVGFVVLLLAGCSSAAKAQESVDAQIQTLLKEGDSAFAKGDYSAAQQSFEKALETAQHLPADSSARYDVLKRLTSTSAASRQFADAERYLHQAVEWRESNIGPKDQKIADDLLLSVNLDMRTKDFGRALATAERVQAMHVEAYTAESLPVADDLLRIGQIYLAEEKPHEAARSLVASIAVRTKLAGSLDPGLLPALDKLIEAFRAIGGGVGTEPLYLQALAIRETLYGENSSELVSTIEGLANVYSGEGMLLAAEPLYLRLLALWESLVGKDHPMIAVTLDKLVVFYAKEGKPEKAREALARSVAIRAHFLAVGLLQQAADAISENQQGRAKVLYNRALVALGPAGPANETLIAQIREALENIQRLPSK